MDITIEHKPSAQSEDRETVTVENVERAERRPTQNPDYTEFWMWIDGEGRWYANAEVQSIE